MIFKESNLTLIHSIQHESCTLSLTSTIPVFSGTSILSLLQTPLHNDITLIPLTDTTRVASPIRDMTAGLPAINTYPVLILQAYPSLMDTWTHVHNDITLLPLTIDNYTVI
jgi:hypothetical protein